eukprot:CAMPEP_0194696334 /NCGR_PEP_ID=MMETSP0295-20121207/22607_1 /TAXON_ID=39354 /ORGANISM="Heterosigma akashiwo, Strain CCMP2393" /LENGTH=38 /DNA_ID= /DNA_START= /DNA_END= /DNA_ORIENTATION=
MVEEIKIVPAVNDICLEGNGSAQLSFSSANANAQPELF